MAAKFVNEARGTHPSYVVCKDTFLSGWGEARGGSSYYVLGVDTDEEAAIVLRNAKDRSDMAGCQLRSSYLFLERRRGQNHVKVVDRAVAARWYEPGRPFRK